MSNVGCAICSNPDPFNAGLCPGCATGSGGIQLIFAKQPWNVEQREKLHERLRDFAAHDADPEAIAQTVMGQKPIAAAPDALTNRVIDAFGDRDIAVLSFPATAWYKTLPRMFTLMLLGIVISGITAGIRATPLMLFASPAVAAILWLGVRRQLTTPLLRFEPSDALLPAPARASLARSLSQLPDGRSRDLLLDIARVAEAGFQMLPQAFRFADLGNSIASLVVAAGPLAVESASLESIAAELRQDGEPARTIEANRISERLDAHYDLLNETLAVLARIARDGATDGADLTALLHEVRADSVRRSEADAIVSSLLHQH